MITLITYPALIAITMLCSYLHGADKLSKGVLIAIMALAGALAGFILTGSLYGLAGALLSPLYWFLWRTSRQAKAELDYMYLVKGSKLIDIAKAYALPLVLSLSFIATGSLLKTPWLALLLLPSFISVAPVLFIAKTNRHIIGREDLDRLHRSRVELANGFAGGVNICIILYLISDAILLFNNFL